MPAPAPAEPAAALLCRLRQAYRSSLPTCADGGDLDNALAAACPDVDDDLLAGGLASDDEAPDERGAGRGRGPEPSREVPGDEPLAALARDDDRVLDRHPARHHATCRGVAGR